MTPAPMRSTSDNDTSQTISSLRVRSPTASIVPAAFFERAVQVGLAGPDRRHRTARTPVTSEARSTNSTTRKSIAIFVRAGYLVGEQAAAPVSDRLVQAEARRTAGERQQHASMKSCWNTRPRPAPSAARIAISLRLPNALARRRLPTLAHAMSRTSATAPSSISKRRTDLADDQLPATARPSRPILHWPSDTRARAATKSGPFPTGRGARRPPA